MAFGVSRSGENAPGAARQQQALRVPQPLAKRWLLRQGCGGLGKEFSTSGKKSIAWNLSGLF